MGTPLAVPRRTLSVDEYHRVGAAGVLREDERIELIEGEMIEMAPIGSRHLAKVNRLSRMLGRVVGEEATVSTQNPLALPPQDEPLPDIALLKARADDYESAIPTAQDVLLVIEVADTTLAYDRDVKIPLYARHGIPEVWLVDVQNQALSIYLDPGPKGYRRLLTPGKGEIISPVLLPRAKVTLAQLWG
jgi:Uma2 family endonuclease